MKVLIDIPDSNVIANTEGCFGISFDGMDYQEIIMGGTRIPDNATNGDILKIVFPNIEWEEIHDIKGNKSIGCTNKFWNAPYKQGDENEVK